MTGHQPLQELDGQSWEITVCGGCHDQILVLGHADRCPGAAELTVRVVPLSVAEKLATAIDRFAGRLDVPNYLHDALAEFRRAYSREETTG